ncbi:MAG: response regulator [Pontibacterium sp.]
MAQIRLLLVDDHPLVLEGITARLSSEHAIQVVGQACNGQDALEQAVELNPDVVLMDISMPIMNGFDASTAFKTQMPDVRVLILSMHEEREYIVKMVQAGAAGYVLKDVSSNELVSAIKTVHQGGTYFSASASQALFSEFGQPVAQHTDTPLTKREETVLKLLAEGGCNKDIARELNISVRTVETHRQNIKQKLNIQTAAGLTKYAIEQKLVVL